MTKDSPAARLAYNGPQAREELMNPKIYVDGQEGTTGLRIHEYLAARSDIEELRIDPEQRKSSAERRRLLNVADVAILCLPDAASREAVAMIDNERTRVIDASTAFRTDAAGGWTYGLPELLPNGAQRAKIKAARRVAVPGCHASAFLLAVAPLVQSGLIPKTATLSCYSLTGYSGGGKKMIAAYEQPAGAPQKLLAPRPYALKLAHKHLPEMQKIAGLEQPPLFTPVVCAVHSGLSVETFLPVSQLTPGTSPARIHAQWQSHYAGEKFVRVVPLDADADLDEGQLDITACNGTNRADLFLFTDEAATQITLFCRLDNLGKGAAGAAVQCLNLMLNADESLALRA